MLLRLSVCLAFVPSLVLSFDAFGGARLTCQFYNSMSRRLSITFGEYAGAMPNLLVPVWLLMMLILCRLCNPVDRKAGELMTRRRHWCPSHDRVVGMFWPDRENAEFFSRTRTTMASWRWLSGLPPTASRKISVALTSCSLKRMWRHNRAPGKTRTTPGIRHASAARLQNSIRQVPRIQIYLQPEQTSPSTTGVSRTEYQCTLEDPDISELNPWTAKMTGELRKPPQTTDGATDQHRWRSVRKGCSRKENVNTD